MLLVAFCFTTSVCNEMLRDVALTSAFLVYALLCSAVRCLCFVALRSAVFLPCLGLLGFDLPPHAPLCPPYPASPGFGLPCLAFLCLALLCTALLSRALIRAARCACCGALHSAVVLPCLGFLDFALPRHAPLCPGSTRRRPAVACLAFPLPAWTCSALPCFAVL